MLFIPATPNGELRKSLMQIVENQKKEGGINVKIVEKAGIRSRELITRVERRRKVREGKLFHTFNRGKGELQ